MTDSIIIHSIINDMITDVENTSKNDAIYCFLSRIHFFYKSMSINKYYIYTLCLCILILFFKLKTKSTFNNLLLLSNLVYSYIFMIIWGWYVHFISHNISFTELYNHFIHKNRSFDTFCLFIFRYTFDFHDQVHHDTSINKHWLFLFIECIQNLLTQGIILFFFHLDKLIHPYIIILWAVTYASAHLINYNLSCIKHCHVDHHKNCKTNYGIDYMDIIMGTKYDYLDIENINHVSINMIIITLILFFL